MRRTKEETARTREQVLEAATDAFYENGVSRTSLDQIARRAGMTRGAIYWHFKDKAELLMALHSGQFLPQERLMDEMLERDDLDPLAFIREGGIDFLRDFQNDERQQKVYAILTLGCEFFGEARETIARITSANEKMLERLTRMVERLQQGGGLSPTWTPVLAARALHACMNGLLSEWIKAERGYDLVEVGTRVIDSLLASMAREGA